jgi:hypothetical protein
MSEPRCYHCGYLLGHIDAAYPICLPNFYGKHYTNQPTTDAECWRVLKKLLKTAWRLHAAADSYKGMGANIVMEDIARFNSIANEADTLLRAREGKK